MNRKQRRKQGITTKVPIYQYNAKTVEEEVLKALEKEREKMQREMLNRIMGSVIVTMHDEFGIGKNRLNRFIDRLNSNYVCIDDGLVTLADMKKWCKEYGVNFEAVFK